MDETAKLCSKCGKNQPSSSHPWCQPCRTEHARQQKQTEAEMLAGRAFQEGAQAMREKIRDAFSMQPVGMFRGIEIAKFVHETDPPQRGVKNGTDSRTIG